MTNEHSVSRWLDGIKAGDEASIAQLWHRYFERLVRLARGKLPGHCRRAYDEEDVALSAFQSFCQRAAGGKFPTLSDRNDLWRLLLTLTLRKAVLTIRHHTRRKRGAGRVMGESAFQDGDRTALGLAEILENGPSPDDAVQFAEDVERRLDQLKDSVLQKIALRKLEGCGVDEIATELGASTRTVERKLRLIRVIWEEGASG